MSKETIRNCENCMNAFDCEKKGELCKERVLFCERRTRAGFTETGWKVFSTEWESVTGKLRKLFKQNVKEDNNVRNAEVV